MSVVLVTGVTGFLGGRIATELEARGHRVRGFARDPERWTDRPAGADSRTGDLVDARAVREAVEGCDAVLHAGALVKMWARDRRDFDRVNVQALSSLAEICHETGARLVYVSSFIALGPTDGEIFDEQTPRATMDLHNDYERTKWVADRIARHLGATGRAVVRLYPGVVFGPGKLTEGNHVVRLLLQHARGRLPGLLGSGDRRQCFAFVDDVARGAVSALESAPDGSGYVLGGENRTALELFEAFERASGIPVPRRRVPLPAAALVGRLQRWRARWFGVEPQLTDEVVAIYRHEWAYTSARAEAEIGYRITPFEQAVERTVEWLRAVGEL